MPRVFEGEAGYQAAALPLEVKAAKSRGEEVQVLGVPGHGGDLRI